MKILVYIDQREGKIKSVAYEALTLAHQLAGNPADVAAVIIGSGAQLASCQASLQGWGTDKVYAVEADNLAHFNSMAYTKAVSKSIDLFKPQVILGGATPMGRELFPRIAARYKGAMATDVIKLSVEGSDLKVLKPYYAGKTLASLRVSGELKFVTLRPNVFTATKCNQGSAAVEKIGGSDCADSRLQTLEVRKGKSERLDLTEASMIVSGGRALGSADAFKILYECADVIHGTVGASRAAVDAGYATHDMQVGQTGKTVNPNLYIACGISGSIQHVAGMRTSKVIVAINTDPDAPVFSFADYGIVADLFQAVPILTQEIKKLTE